MEADRSIDSQASARAIVLRNPLYKTPGLRSKKAQNISICMSPVRKLQTEPVLTATPFRGPNRFLRVVCPEYVENVANNTFRQEDQEVIEDAFAPDVVPSPRSVMKKVKIRKKQAQSSSENDEPEPPLPVLEEASPILHNTSTPKIVSNADKSVEKLSLARKKLSTTIDRQPCETETVESPVPLADEDSPFFKVPLPPKPTRETRRKFTLKPSQEPFPKSFPKAPEETKKELKVNVKKAKQSKANPVQDPQSPIENEEANSSIDQLYESARYLTNWIPRMKGKKIVIEGQLLDFSAKDPRHYKDPWKTSRITERIQQNLVMSKSGAYVLEGLLDFKKAMTSSTPQFIITAFKKGFPEDWDMYRVQWRQLNLQQRENDGLSSVTSSTINSEQSQFLTHVNSASNSKAAQNSESDLDDQVDLFRTKTNPKRQRLRSNSATSSNVEITDNEAEPEVKKSKAEKKAESKGRGKNNSKSKPSSSEKSQQSKAPAAAKSQSQQRGRSRTRKNELERLDIDNIIVEPNNVKRQLRSNTSMMNVTATNEEAVDESRIESKKASAKKNTAKRDASKSKDETKKAKRKSNTSEEEAVENVSRPATKEKPRGRGKKGQQKVENKSPDRSIQEKPKTATKRGRNAKSSTEDAVPKKRSKMEPASSNQKAANAKKDSKEKVKNLQKVDEEPAKNSKSPKSKKTAAAKRGRNAKSSTEDAVLKKRSKMEPASSNQKAANAKKDSKEKVKNLQKVDEEPATNSKSPKGKKTAAAKRGRNAKSSTEDAVSKKRSKMEPASRNQKAANAKKDSKEKVKNQQKVDEEPAKNSKLSKSKKTAAAKKPTTASRSSGSKKQSLEKVRHVSQLDDLPGLSALKKRGKKTNGKRLFENNDRILKAYNANHEDNLFKSSKKKAPKKNETQKASDIIGELFDSDSEQNISLNSARTPITAFFKRNQSLLENDEQDKENEFVEPAAFQCNAFLARKSKDAKKTHKLMKTAQNGPLDLSKLKRKPKQFDKDTKAISRLSQELLQNSDDDESGAEEYFTDLDGTSSINNPPSGLMSLLRGKK